MVAVLAARAGLDVSDGITMDEHLRTSDLDTYAAGDVASAHHPRLQRHIRVEHWANAQRQGVTAAKTMMGQSGVCDRTPYFFLGQYDLGMEYTGQVGPAGYDQVVFRGSLDNHEFIVFWLADGRILAGMNVNTWDVADTIDMLIQSGRRVDVQRLADSTVPLEQM